RTCYAPHSGEPVVPAEHPGCGRVTLGRVNAPPGGTRWLAVAAYAFFVTMLGTTLPTPLYALYSAQWGLSGVSTTVVFATYAVGVILGLVLLGRSSDTAGRRPLLIIGLGLAALSALAFLLADGLGWLLLGRLLSGLSAGVFTGTATTALVELAGPMPRRTASLLATAVNMLGLGTGPLLAGTIAQWGPDPLRTPYLLHLVLLVPAAIGLSQLPETVHATGPVRIAPLRLTLPAEVRPAFWPAALAGFAGFATLGLFTAVEPRFLSQVLGISDHLAAGAMVSGVFVASTLAQIASTRISTRVALPLGCAALVIGMLLVVLALETSGLVVLIAGSLVTGAGQGMSFRAAMDAVSRLSPPGRGGEVTSTLFVVFYVAISVPVLGVGLLAAGPGLLDAALIFAIGVAVLAVLAALRLWRRPVTA
ncbi:MAG: MFS transporter, partial [Janthinobacterium lividum]